MPPKPNSPHAAEILQNYWEESLEPGELMRRSVEFGRLSAQLVAASEDGQVQAMQLLNYGRGVLADTISATWQGYFVRVGIAAGQVGEASANLAAWATTLGAMLSEMAGVVGWAESAIEALEAARVALEAAGENVDALIEQIKAEAKTQIAAISAAASGALATIPSWAARIPMTAPKAGNGLALENSSGIADRTPRAGSSIETAAHDTGVIDRTPSTAAAVPGSAAQPGVAGYGAPSGGVSSGPDAGSAAPRRRAGPRRRQQVVPTASR
ncbi:MAG: hypothetical protein K0U80_14905 [Actinomycetia bacterium]|nr:hypothetical protein [Actinomycetes bacterium]MCH9761033.1 hypothetical protein [Actinomycetes bacterium]